MSDTAVKVTGTLERLDVGPGAWVLVAGDGRRFALLAKPKVAAALRQGARVTVEGEPVEALGVGMTGDPALAVSKVSSSGFGGRREPTPPAAQG